MSGLLSTSTLEVRLYDGYAVLLNLDISYCEVRRMYRCITIAQVQISQTEKARTYNVNAPELGVEDYDVQVEFRSSHVWFYDEADFYPESGIVQLQLSGVMVGAVNVAKDAALRL